MSYITQIEVGGTTYDIGVNVAIDGLSNVTITSVAENQILKYDGEKWVNASITSGSTTLSGLTDVTITSVASGQVLKYDGEKWVNGADSGAVTSATQPLEISNGALSLNYNLTGVGALAYDSTSHKLYVPYTCYEAGSGISIGNDYKIGVSFSGSGTATSAARSDHSHSLGDVSGVTVSNPANNQTLVYSNGTWINDGISVNMLSDVSAASPSNGQLLVYNSTTNKWESTNFNSGGTKVVEENSKISLQPVTNLTTTYPGSARGNGAVDLQMGRSSDTCIAAAPYSVAMGYSNRTNGIYGAAIGDNNIVNTQSAVAVGSANTVGGNYGFATGRSNNVSAYYAIAMGSENTASAINSVAMGGGNTTYSGALGSVAMGGSNTVYGVNSIAIGGSNTAKLSSIALGQSNNSIGGCSVAMGKLNYVDGAYAVAMGYDNSASNYFSVAMGFSNVANSYSSVAIGSRNIAGIKYGTSTGYCCHNVFHSVATNFDIPADKEISFPSDNLIMHSGKLSATLRRDNPYDNSTFELMDFTNMMFNGVLNVQGVYISNTNVVYTVEAVVHIVNNAIVGITYRSYYSSSYNSNPTSAPNLPISGTLLSISNRKLYHAALTNGVYGQIGIDYTCVAEIASGGYGYGGTYGGSYY